MTMIIPRLRVGLNRLKSARRMQSKVTIAIQNDEAKGRAKHGIRYNWQGYRLRGENGNSPQFRGRQRTIKL
jgi:hypothetical protein